MLTTIIWTICITLMMLIVAFSVKKDFESVKNNKNERNV